MVRNRFNLQERRIGVSVVGSFTHFLLKLCCYIGTAVLGCIPLVCFLGTWSFSFRAHNTTPSITSAAIRIFGPSLNFNPYQTKTPVTLDERFSFQQYTTTEQRDFLLKYGHVCQSWTNEDRNLLLERFDNFQSSPYYQVELWKYCMLYTGVGNFYYDAENLAMLYDWSEFLEKINDNKFASIALTLGRAFFESYDSQLIHESLLYFSQPKSYVALKMIKVLVDTPTGILYSRDILPKSLALAVEKDVSDASALWRFWTVSCQALAPNLRDTNHVVGSHTRPMCSTPGGYCCQVMLDQNGLGNLPVLALRHPGRVNTLAFENDTPPLPYLFDEPQGRNQHPQNENLADLPYISTIRLVDLRVTPPSELETPNFFDILIQNDCVPTQRECHDCLKRRGNCNACRDECPCYCKVLCQVRPPPKHVTQEFWVRLPMHRKDPSRLIPRIVHQTWFEAVTPTKYPNMSRLTKSWSTSGWDYRFYDDSMATAFLSEHFPPQVREAYDALVPGAFKADLFRYCVLLIYGGVYADMDVLLESNLDHAVAPDVGFMTPIDEPGSDVGHQSCLWNGFLAVAPGHPVMAKVVELVVNHIRNRFTSVDYDDMLCPNPVLSVTHTVDTLFTSGPCILGAALNLLMKRHAQTEFEIGTLNIYGASTVKTTTSSTGDVQNEDDEDEEDDPRWLFPGRTIILHQNKQDMGAHRFTWLEQDMLVASTDFPDYDDRPPTLQHYSKAHENIGVYGLQRLYRDRHARVNENILIRVLPLHHR